MLYLNSWQYFGTKLGFVPTSGQTDDDANLT